MAANPEELSQMQKDILVYLDVRGGVGDWDTISLLVSQRFEEEIGEVTLAITRLYTLGFIIYGEETPEEVNDLHITSEGREAIEGYRTPVQEAIDALDESTEQGA